MLPKRLLIYSEKNGEIVPHFLDQGDHTWLRLLVDEFLRFDGKRRRDLLSFLKTPFIFESPEGKRRLAQYFLLSQAKSRLKTRISPVLLRAAAFSEAGKYLLSVNEILENLSTQFATTSADIQESLFSDLEEEKILDFSNLKTIPIPDLCLKINSLLAKGFIFRTLTLKITLLGNSRPVIRHAKLRGLLCTVTSTPEARTPQVVLQISGPFSIFRKTTLYGRHLSEILPLLQHCHKYKLQAKSCINSKNLVLRLQSGDPIHPSEKSKVYDSKIEARFARAFEKTTSDWSLIREPEPLEADGTLIFPDFLIVHRRNHQKRYFLEIIGFWTPEYLETKLSRLLKTIISETLILCIHESLNCSNSEMQRKFTNVIYFKNSICPKQILNIINLAGSS